MTALSELGADDSLPLVNGFHPVPPYEVLASRGFDHGTERVADDGRRTAGRRYRKATGTRGRRLTD